MWSLARATLVIRKSPRATGAPGWGDRFTGLRRKTWSRTSIGIILTITKLQISTSLLTVAMDVIISGDIRSDWTGVRVMSSRRKFTTSWVRAITLALI